MNFKATLIITAALLLGFGAFRLVCADTAKEKTYEIQPDVVVAGYKSDSDRLMDAYERLMERYMNMAEGNTKLMTRDMDKIIAKLDAIEAKINGLSVRIAEIEKALNPAQDERKTEEKTD